MQLMFHVIELEDVVMRLEGHEVETVLPGALVPALLDDHGPIGRFCAAQDYRDLER